MALGKVLTELVYVVRRLPLVMVVGGTQSTEQQSWLDHHVCWDADVLAEVRLFNDIKFIHEGSLFPVRAGRLFKGVLGGFFPLAMAACTASELALICA